MNARVACLLLLAACAQETPNTPPSPPVQSAAVPPPAPGPAPRAEHPLDRIPSRPEPDDPVRNPATPPELIKSVPPKYTAIARKARIQGVVILEVLIERDGSVSDARVLKSLPMGLDAAARQAVLYWRYEPGRNVRGEPVRTLLHITVPFRLRD